MPKTGRPPAPIDWETAKKLAHFQCTQEEIAYFLGISPDTLFRRSIKEQGQTFSQFMKVHADGGKISLRRWQWKNAEKGNVAMQIWLGKQYLDQKQDPTPAQDSPNGGPTFSIQGQVDQLVEWLTKLDKI